MCPHAAGRRLQTFHLTRPRERRTGRRVCAPRGGGEPLHPFFAVRKPRSDSKLRTLPTAQLNKLREWLGVEGMSYDDAIKNVREEFGVKTSRAALSEFYTAEVVPWKYARANGLAQNFASLAGGEINEATRKSVEQLAFEIATSPRPDLDALSTLCKILDDSAKRKQAGQKLSHDARRIALLERKAAQADQAEGVLKDNGLTDEQRTQRMRQIFHM
jgi:hypothetical protein